MTFHPGQKVTVTFPEDYSEFPELAGRAIEGTIRWVGEYERLKIVLSNSRIIRHNPKAPNSITVEPVGAIAAQEGQP